MSDTHSTSTRRASPRQNPPELKQRATRMVLESFDRGEALELADALGILARGPRSWSPLVGPVDLGLDDPAASASR